MRDSYPSRTTCPICGQLLVPPCGPNTTKVLVFGEFPGFRELQSGRPWSGPAGEVLYSELRRAGVNASKLRMTNIWLHEPSADPKELDWHMARLMQELRDKVAVLMLGSDVSKIFLQQSVTEVSGLRVKSKLLPDTVRIAIPCRNPAAVLMQGGTLGEVRLAIGRFAEAIKRYE